MLSASESESQAILEMPSWLALVLLDACASSSSDSTGANAAHGPATTSRADTDGQTVPTGCSSSPSRRSQPARVSARRISGHLTGSDSAADFWPTSTTARVLQEILKLCDAFDAFDVWRHLGDELLLEIGQVLSMPHLRLAMGDTERSLTDEQTPQNVSVSQSIFQSQPAHQGFVMRGQEVQEGLEAHLCGVQCALHGALNRRRGDGLHQMLEVTARRPCSQSSRYSIWHTTLRSPSLFHRKWRWRCTSDGTRSSRDSVVLIPQTYESRCKRPRLNCALNTVV